jgi:hypothetical protein
MPSGNASLQHFSAPPPQMRFPHAPTDSQLTAGSGWNKSPQQQQQASFGPFSIKFGTGESFGGRMLMMLI